VRAKAGAAQAGAGPAPSVGQRGGQRLGEARVAGGEGRDAAPTSAPAAQNGPFVTVQFFFEFCKGISFLLAIYPRIKVALRVLTTL